MMRFRKKKVSVTETSFDSSVEDIQWAGHDFDTVLLKTSSGRLFISHDTGKVWTEKTEDLPHPIDEGQRLEPLVETIYLNPVDRNIIVLVAKKRAHYISTDAGKSFVLVESKVAIHNWVFHPKRSNWALFSKWSRACTSPGGNGNDDVECNHLLYVTKDLGKTAHLVGTYVVQYSWGDTKFDQQDLVYFTHHRFKSGPQLRGTGWSSSVDFVVGDTHGDTYTKLVTYGNKFLLSNGYIFVAKLLDEETQSVALMVSSDGGKSFQQASIPTPLHEKSYTILDTSEGAVLIHVHHHGFAKGVEFGNVYISDAKGLRYSLSLPNNIRMSSGAAEIDRVQGLEGVYLANFRDENYITDLNGSEDKNEYFDELAEDEQEAEEEEEMDTQMHHRQKTHHGKTEEPVRTVISFDKGGLWTYLKPPTRDSRGNAITCPNPTRCWLHLHGASNYRQFAPFYSVENAVGVVMGTGNVGSHLRHETDEVNTYLSRDGGLTWSEVHKGAYIYEFGDHGGLILMADTIKKTNQVVFSWNEGQSWYDFTLGDTYIDVDNIVIEPNSSSIEFLIYGTRGDTGVLFHLDFSTLGQSHCTGVWAPDSVSSDYESWIPSDGRNSHGEKCMLGREVTYTRRKQTSECFNGRDFERPIFKRNCKCTVEDYECDFGFMRGIDDSTCRPDMESPDLLTPLCRTGKHYTATAYRKVPGDTCVDGWVPGLTAIPCPPHSPFSRGAKTILTVLFLIIIFVSVINCLSQNPQWTPGLLNYGIDSFKQVRYTVLGGSKKEKGHERTGGFEYNESDDGFDDVEDGSTVLGAYSTRKRKVDTKKSETARRTGDKNYASELGFIESAQEESDGGAPTLTKYRYNYQDVSSDEERLMDVSVKDKDTSNDLLDKSPQVETRSRPAASPSGPLPRLAPPPTSGLPKIKSSISSSSQSVGATAAEHTSAVAPQQGNMAVKGNRLGIGSLSGSRGGGAKQDVDSLPDSFL